jgi:hypothetical protein
MHYKGNSSRRSADPRSEKSSPKSSADPKRRGKDKQWDKKGAVEGPASGGDPDAAAEENVGDRDASAVAEGLDYPVSRANELGKKKPRRR